METSAEIGHLAEALAKAQAEIKGATRDSDNPFFNSRYADLEAVWEACRTALTNHQIGVIQAPATDGNKVAVTTMLVHSSGQWARSTIGSTPKDMLPQSVGSVITYLRRYGLAAMAGVAPKDDDDGNAGQGNAAPKRGRQDRSEAAQAARREESVASAPYRDRPQPSADMAAILARREQLPPSVKALVPTDEAALLMAPEEEERRGVYIEELRQKAAEMKMNASEKGDLMLTFFGSRRAALDEPHNIWLLKALHAYVVKPQ